MSIRWYEPFRRVPVILGVVTLTGVGLLLLWDIVPALFPAGAHEFLAAFPLALIACACLAWKGIRQSSRMEVVKAIVLASAFLFWAVNQFSPTLPQATLFNDLAIALFVFDVLLGMIERPVRIP
jgi:hypothetical protein